MCETDRVHRTRSQDGFGLVELLIATMVLAFALMGFAAILGAAVRENVKGRKRTEAQQLATSAIERYRAMGYDDVGTVGGNPVGLIPATTAAGRYTVTTKVKYVNDAVPGSFTTYQDYKLVSVQVKETATGRVWAAPETKFAPPGTPGQNEGVVKVTAMDVDNTPLTGAAINLTNGPSPNRSDTTDPAGEAVFAGLAPNPTPADGNPYDVTATVPGYVTLPSDTPPAASARFRVAPASVFTTVIRMVREITVTVSLKNPDGTPFTQASTLTATSATQSGTSPITQVLTSKTLGTMPYLKDTYRFRAYVVPAPGTTLWFASPVEKAIPNNYPGDLTAAVDLVMAPYAKGKIQVRVRKGSVTGPVVNGADVTLTGGPADLLLTQTTTAGGTTLFTVPLVDPATPQKYAVSVTYPTGTASVTYLTNRNAQGTTTVETVVIP